MSAQSQDRKPPAKSRPPLIKDAVRYKTVLCQNWQATGQCPYTWKCQFAHGEEELCVRTRGGKQAAAADARATESLDTERKGKSQRGRVVPLGVSRTHPHDKQCVPITNSRAASPQPDPSQPESKHIVGTAADAKGAVSASDTSADLAACAEPPLCQEVDASVPSPEVHAVAQFPHIMHLILPVLKQPAGQGSGRLPLAVNHTTGKVETNRCAPAREASFSTMLIRRQMSNLLDELSKEASAKQIEIM